MPHAPFRPLAVAVLFAALALPAARGEEEPAGDDVVARACHGIVTDALAAYRTGDDAARKAAKDTMRGRALFFLPYVRAAAESTADATWRARCLALSADLREAAGIAGDGAPPAAAEFPSFENAFPWRPPPDEEDGLAAADRLREDDRIVEAARRIVAYARIHPEDLLDAIDAALWRDYHDDAEAAAVIEELEGAAQAIAEGADRERASQIALGLANWYRADRDARLADVARRYEGTAAARVAQVKRILSSDEKVERRVERLAAFAEAHPGTEAAVLAWKEVAFQYGCSNLSHVLQTPWARFEKLAETVVRLEGPDCPGAEGPIAAVRQLVEFYAGYPAPPQDAARRMLEAYRSFFANHFLADVLEGEGYAMGEAVPYWMASIHRGLGVAEDALPAAVDRELARIEAAVPDKAAVRYLRAERRAMTGDREEADAAFAAVANAFPGTLYARKALAARAGLAYAAQRFEEAADLYATYAEAHPDSPFTPFARLRIANAHAGRGAFAEAIHAYEALASSPGRNTLGLAVMLPVALGRSLEATGALPDAIAAYRRALAAWPPDGPPDLETAQRFAGTTPAEEPEADRSLRRETLAGRIRWLSRPGWDPADLGRLLQGDRLREAGKREEALAIWRYLASEQPDGPAGRAARERMVELLLDVGLDAADRSDGEADEARARDALARAAATGDRFGRLAAAVGDAALRLRAGEEAEAGAIVEEALAAFQATQALRMSDEDPESLAARLLQAAFAPQDRRYRRDARTELALPYVVVASTVRLVQPDGTTLELEVTPPLAQVPHVLYLRDGELALLGRLVARMGVGPDAGDDADTVPGSAEQIAELLGRFFAVRPGHWGGWHLFAYPSFHEFRVEDEAATRATAAFRWGYQGGDVTLVRDGETWQIAEVEYRWIE